MDIVDDEMNLPVDPPEGINPDAPEAPEMLRQPEGLVYQRPDFFAEPLAEELEFTPRNVDTFYDDPNNRHMLGVPRTVDQSYDMDRMGMEDQPSSFSEKMGAMLESENVVGSYYAKYKDMPTGATEEDMFAVERGWTSMQAMEMLGIRDEEVIKMFAGVQTPSLLQWELNNYKRERNNRAIMEKMNIGESLGMGLAVATVDPVSWLMAAIPISKAGFAGRAAWGATVGATEAAAAEVMLHSSQRQRTVAESWMGVGATAIFGGTLGAAFGRRDMTVKLQKDLDEAEAIQKEELADGVGTEWTGDGPVSADKTFVYDTDVDIGFQNKIRRRTRLDKDDPDFLTKEQGHDIIAEESNKNTRVWGAKLMAPLAKISPMLAVSLSESTTARKAIELMTDSALIKNKHFKGIKSGPSLDSQISMVNSRIMITNHNIIMDAYTKYAGQDMSKGAGRAEFKARVGATKLGGKKHLSLEEFKAKLTDVYEAGAVYKGSDEVLGKHLVEAAQNRKQFMTQEYESMMVKEGMIKPDNHKEIKAYDDFIATQEARIGKADAQLTYVDELEALNEKIANLESQMDGKLQTELDAKLAKEGKKLSAKDKAARQKKAKEQQEQLNKLMLDAEAVLKKSGKGNTATTRRAYEAREKARAELDAHLDKPAPEPSFVATTPYGSEWYLPRIFRAENVSRYKEEFVTAVVDDWIYQAGKHIDEVKSPAQKKLYEKRLEDMKTNRKDLEAKARQIADDISESAVPKLNIEYIGKTNVRKKHRALRVRTEALRDVQMGGKNRDFIERDIMAITRGHTTSMTPELVMLKNGFDMDKIIEGVRGDYASKIKTEQEKGTKIGKIKAEKLRLDQRGIEKRLVGLYQQLNNDYRRPNDPAGFLNQTRLVLQQYNMMRMLGSMTVSAITDLGNFVSHMGLKNSAQSFRMLSPKYFGGSRQLRKQEARKLGVVVEMVTASRLNAMALSDEFGPNMSSTARHMHNYTKNFTYATGMNHWNAGLKEVAVLSYADNIIAQGDKITNALKKRSKIDKDGNWIDKKGNIMSKPVSDRNMRQFATAGLDENDLIEISAAYKKAGGSKQDGVRLMEMDKWVDENGALLPVAENFLAVLKRQSDMAIVTPGAGDLPLWMRTPVGGMIGQFKSFQFTAINRIMLPNMQKMALGDPSAFVGMPMQFGLAAGAYHLKMYGMGREEEANNASWETLADEMISRSGYFGILSDATVMMDKLTRGRLNTRFSDAQMSRYYSRSFAGDLIGPTGATVRDAGRVVSSLFSEEGLNKGDLSAMRRMLPYQNLYWTRRKWQQGEEYLANQLGQ